MIPNITYYVTYPCPRCRMELEAENRGWRGWLRCPGCGTPALPPEILPGHPATRRRVMMADLDSGTQVVIDEDSVDEWDKDEDDDLVDLEDGASRPTIGAPPAPASALRMVLIGALTMSLFVLLVAYLDDNRTLTTLFGGLAFIFFLLLLRSPNRGSA